VKILFLIPELGYGGAETAMLRLARQLSVNNAITIAVFRLSYSGGEYTNATLDTGLEVIELDSSVCASPGLMPGIMGRWWRRIKKLHQLKHQHDLAISFLSGSNLLNVLVPAGRPCVISERGSRRHDVGQHALKHLLWLGLLDPLTYRLADVIVCVSEGLSQEVRSVLPRRLHCKVQTIAGYLEPEQALAAGGAMIEPEFLSLSARPMLVAAGRLHPSKGFQYLLPLFAQAAPQVPQSGLLIIGDGPLQHQLATQARALGLSVSEATLSQPIDTNAQVIFLGYRQQPARYTRLGRAFVLSSLSEGLPNMLLEALAAGSWTLAADCPYGPSEVMKHPELGRLLPPIWEPASQQPWLDALVHALRRPAPAVLPHGLRQQLAERFSIQASGLRWDALLNELVS